MIPPEYIDYTDVFSPNLVMELPKNTGINKHVIELIEGEQPPHGSIYNLGLVELETLNTYIETHLKTGFIQPFKSPAGASIILDKKPEGILWLYVDY